MALVGWKMMIVCAVVALSSLLAVGGRAEAKGLFDEKDHLTELKLDEAGTNGWSGALKKTDKPGAIFYPGEMVNIDIAITNKGKGNLAIKPVLEVVPVGFNFAGYGGMGDPMISGQIMIIRPRGKAVRTDLAAADIGPGESVTLELRKLKCERFGLYAIIIEIPGKGRQAVATVFRAHKVPEVDRWESPLMYHKGHGHLPIKEVARLGYKWVRTDTFPNWKSVDT
ncbi:MAG: hypothetical protein QGD94_12350, partial [Planctomycetia bacterium]|nr:hypothetical protein [Planctomycetia bacterium]